MSDEINNTFRIDPSFRKSLTAEQQLTLEKIERLGELDPVITERLARALDRLQMTLPYQQVARRSQTSASAETEKTLEQLSPAERQAREDFINQELSALLVIAGQMTQAFQTEKPRAQADKRFKDNLRAQFTRPASH
ncbi:MAG TPA: hypothetical protein VH186_10400 [Chloroflexia bacterium]|nr:hypothetical protein [Chloroflexia bacterium]